MKLNVEKVRPIVEGALMEDIGDGDITTGLLIPPDQEAEAVIVTREECVMCGLPVAEMVFKNVDKHLKIELLVEEGERVRPQSDLMRVSGRAGSILSAERTALNFLQRLSGIATLTSSYVEKAKPFNSMIFDTRKTTPNLRILEKYAVRIGGGQNHRKGLYDAFLIKENHQDLVKKLGLVNLSAFVKKARERYPKRWIEIEVNKIEDLGSVIAANPDAILLDNFPVTELKQAVEIIGDKISKEASGNVNLETVEMIASSGVDRISVGRLTHSVHSIDMALDFVE